MRLGVRPVAPTSSSMSVLACRRDWAPSAATKEYDRIRLPEEG
jgi:hypothetical protein